MAENGKGLLFDPGFAPYILVFRGTLEYLYADINRYRNFSQKKAKFLQYYKKILEIFDNNTGFYAGCLMWAAYIKAQPKQEIIANPCLNTDYNEDENIADTQYLLKFTELFPKDVKYYLSKDFQFDSNIIKLISVYENFLIINKGFTNTKLNTDLKIPNNLIITNTDKFKSIIENAIKSENLSLLNNEISNILK